MTDMTTYEMLDDVNLSVEAAHITAKTKAIAGYVNGDFANWPAIVAKYSKAGKFLLSIDVQGNPSIGAQCLDVEKGDAEISQAPGWCKTTRANGVAAKDLRYFPKLYVQESNAQALVSAMSAAGIVRDTWMLWTAHYGKGEHICGPKTCGCPVQADATQWSSTFDGASLDASLCYGYFFSGPGDVLPAVAVTLGTPMGLSANASYRGVDLGWSAVKGAGSYDVQLLQRGVPAGRIKSEAAHVSLPVDAGTAYTWRVAALPGGDWSAEDGFTTPKAPLVPAVAEAAAIPEAVKPPKPHPKPVTVSGVVEIPGPAVHAVTDDSGAVQAPPTILVYVMETLEAEIAQKLGLPAGTLVFIPHTVEGA